MSTASDRLREIVEALGGSTSLLVGAIVPLLGHDDVSELVLAMPDATRADFLAWCSRMRAGGPPLREWSPEFAHGFDAVCRWMDENRPTP